METITSIKHIVFLITAVLILKLQYALFLADSSAVYVFALIHYPLLHSEAKNNLVSFFLLHSFSFLLPTITPRKTTLVSISLLCLH